MALAASYKRKLPVVAPIASRWGSPGNAPIFAGKENRAKPLYPRTWEEEEEEEAVFIRGVNTGGGGGGGCLYS